MPLKLFKLGLQGSQFSDVGGLENLTAWFKTRAPAFANTARYAGLPLPKGVLLVGVPGFGLGGLTQRREGAKEDRQGNVGQRNCRFIRPEGLNNGPLRLCVSA